MLTSGYLTYQLTGKFVDSVGCQAAYIPFDYKSQTWAAPSDWKWLAVPMDPAILPDLVPPAGALGEITPQAAAATGIPAGLQADRRRRRQSLRGNRLGGCSIRTSAA